MIFSVAKYTQHYTQAQSVIRQTLAFSVALMFLCINEGL